MSEEDGYLSELQEREMESIGAGGACGQPPAMQLRVNAAADEYNEYTRFWTPNVRVHNMVGIFSRFEDTGINCDPQELAYVLRCLGTPLDADNPRFLHDVLLVDKGFMLMSVARVQNQDALERLLLFKKQHPGRESIGFHGTSAANADKICQFGFQTVEGVRALYGRGTYTTPQWRMALNYSDPLLLTPPLRNDVPTTQTFLLVSMAHGDAEAIGKKDCSSVIKDGKMVTLFRNEASTIFAAPNSEQLLVRYRITVCSVWHLWHCKHINCNTKLFTQKVRPVWINRWRLHMLMQSVDKVKLLEKSEKLFPDTEPGDHLQVWSQMRILLDDGVFDSRQEDEWKEVKWFFDGQQYWLDDKLEQSKRMLMKQAGCWPMTDLERRLLYATRGIRLAIPDNEEDRQKVETWARQWLLSRAPATVCSSVAAAAPAAGPAPKLALPGQSPRMPPPAQATGRRWVVGDTVCVNDTWAGLQLCHGLVGTLKQIAEVGTNTGTSTRFVVQLDNLHECTQRLLMRNATNKKHLNFPNSCGWSENDGKPKLNFLCLPSWHLAHKRPKECPLDWQVDNCTRFKAFNSEYPGKIPTNPSFAGSLVTFGYPIHGVNQLIMNAHSLQNKHGRVYSILRRHDVENSCARSFVILVGAFEELCTESWDVKTIIDLYGRNLLSPPWTPELKAWKEAEEKLHMRPLVGCLEIDLQPALDPMVYRDCFGDHQMTPIPYNGPDLSVGHEDYQAWVLKIGHRVTIDRMWVSMEDLVGLEGRIVSKKIVKTYPRHCRQQQEHAGRWILLVVLDGHLKPELLNYKQKQALNGTVHKTLQAAYEEWIDDEYTTLGKALIPNSTFPVPLLVCYGCHIKAKNSEDLNLPSAAAGGSAQKKQKKA